MYVGSVLEHNIATENPSTAEKAIAFYQCILHIPNYKYTCTSIPCPGRCRRTTTTIPQYALKYPGRTDDTNFQAQNFITHTPLLNFTILRQTIDGTFTLTPVLVLKHEATTLQINLSVRPYVHCPMNIGSYHQQLKE